jgi:lipopolysaccharide export system protein LptA
MSRLAFPVFLRALLPLCAALCAFLCHVPCALAEKADRDKPVNYQGDSLGGNTDSQTADLVGNVVITQGTLTIHADRIHFHHNPDNSVSATAFGNPVSFREKRDDVDEYYEGFAQRIVYDGTKRIVELFDRALLKRTGDELRGNYIQYNAENNTFKAEGRPDAKPPLAGETPLGPRVRGVFLPQPKDSKDAKDGKESKDGKAPVKFDDKGGKDAKDPKDNKAAVQKPSDPVPLKADSSLKVETPK